MLSLIAPRLRLLRGKVERAMGPRLRGDDEPQAYERLAETRLRQSAEFHREMKYTAGLWRLRQLGV
jgi:hypothetical protein